MMRVHILLNEEAEKIITEKLGERKNGISQYVSNLIIQDGQIEKLNPEEVIEKLKSMCRNTDKNVTVLLDTFNNFLEFTTMPGQEYMPMEQKKHDWIQKAEENREKHIHQQMAQKRYKMT